MKEVNNVPPELHVLMSGEFAGWLKRDKNGKVSFKYDETYRNNVNATPLSLVLPISKPLHSGRKLNSWLAGLLPDNPNVLERWGRQFKVSWRSPYALLAFVGTDCAGAVQFLQDFDKNKPQEGSLAPLSETYISDRLQALIADPSAWTPAMANGQFSLAGVQAKMALRLHKSSWVLPSGSEPTSHIFKLPMQNYDLQLFNEHLCLKLSRPLGIPAAESELLTFRGIQALVVTRYDRREGKRGNLLRIHQEDLCQALGFPPSSKYQSDQGPGPLDIIKLFQSVMGPEQSKIAIETFIRALAMSWVLAGTDAHAKNYSLLLSGSQVRLAPLYDLNSALPYLVDDERALTPGKIGRTSARLAMTIGGKSLIQEIDRYAWEDFAKIARLDPEEILELVKQIVENAPQALSDVVAAEKSHNKLNSVQNRFANKFAKDLSRQSQFCLTSLKGRAPGSKRNVRRLNKSEKD